MSQTQTESRHSASNKRDYFWNEVNPNVKEVKYAVRGVVPMLADSIKEELLHGTANYPFQEVAYCNITNPQQFGQKPITFLREVLSCVINPDLLNIEAINLDARNRARTLLTEIVSPGSYPPVLGYTSVRESVARFIAKIDSVPKPSIENIILTDGASQGAHLLLNALIMNSNDAVMIPVPTYPLYSAAISLYGGSPAPYYMNEARNWEFGFQQLEKGHADAIKQGKTVKAIVIINPGNPTGSILSFQTVKTIIQFSVKHKLVIIADEVYRDNVYKEGITFHSFRKVLEKMNPQYKDNCELASMHSISKGLIGESGLKGGYMYLHNFNPAVVEQVVKLKSVNISGNSMGQIALDIMVNPPLEGVSKETKEKYLYETSSLLESLKHRAKLLTKHLNEMTNVHVKEIDGAMCAFPEIKFSERVLQAAQKQGKEPDLFYCIEVLKNTGIALVPGSGFKQLPGTYHFRITNLILPESSMERKLETFKKFNESFHNKYMD